MAEELTEKSGSRRDFLKKSVAVGAAVWTAPAIVSLPGGRAWALQYPVCNCDADAFGLSVNILGSGEQVFGQATSCVLPTGVIGIPDTATVEANIICGSATSSTDGACFAQAGLVSTLDVIVGPALAPTLRVQATVLNSQASADCDPCATTGSSSVATLRVSGTLAGGVIDLNAVTTCNLDVAGLGLVIVNEQTCENGTLNVNALHVTVPGVIDLVVGHSEAGATGCACTPCGAIA